MSSGEPLALLRAKVAGYVMNESRGALWAEINAAALRKPEIAEICNRMETWIVGRLIEVFAHAAGLPPDRARARFGAHAGVIVLAVKASAIARANTERADVDALVLRMLDSLLDEVVHHEG